MTIINKYMKTYFKNLRKNIKSGFTLIELLVVIGILGVLAAALVATIDPFEQLKKAQDTNTTNALVEWLNATTRYYTTHSAYPWDTVANGGANCHAGAVPTGDVSLLSTGAMNDCTTALIGDNELKQAFATSNNLKYIFITQEVANNQTVGCFNPSSKSILHNANTHYTVAGVDAGVLCDTTAHKDANPTSCYWCTR